MLCNQTHLPPSPPESVPFGPSIRQVLHGVSSRPRIAFPGLLVLLVSS